VFVFAIFLHPNQIDPKRPWDPEWKPWPDQQKKRNLALTKRADVRNKADADINIVIPAEAEIQYDTSMKLIVGLGNPGKKHENTRHNIGWRVVEHLSLHLDAGELVKNEKFSAAISEAKLGGEKILFAEPLTFMNASGKAVAALKHFYKIELEDVLVVHDEMDFAVGKFAFAKDGGDAGHNGIRSIIDALGSDVFARLRVGIDRPKPPLKKEDYVLQPFDMEEVPTMELVKERTSEAAYDWAKQGLTKAMNMWNGV